MAQVLNHTLPPAGDTLLLQACVAVQLCKKTFTAICDKSVFISAWLNGNDRDLKSNITEQNNKKKKNGTTNNKMKTKIPTIHLSMYNFDK